MRGEYGYHDDMNDMSIGSPPLARGIQKKSGDREPDPGITPACAGNTRGYVYVVFVVEDHPRLRGEYFTAATNSSEGLGSPPLARGIPVVGADIDYINRITPACAGNTR